MNVRRFEDFDAFYDVAVPYLQQREIVHILPLGFLHAWKRTTFPTIPVYMAAAERDGQTLGVAMRIGANRAILCEAADVSAAELFAGDMTEAFVDSPLPGAMGDPVTVKAFVDAWERLTGVKARLNRAERIYQLKEVIPVSNVSGTMRAATEADTELMIDWLRAFEIEADPSAEGDTPRETYLRGIRLRLESPVDIGGLRFWEDDGRIVSFAGYSGPTGNGIRIGPVYTPPEHRGHGYASALTAALTQELLDQGKSFVALFTDLSNPTSNSIYQKIGYRPICDVDEYVFDGV